MNSRYKLNRSKPAVVKNQLPGNSLPALSLLTPLQKPLLGSSCSSTGFQLKNSFIFSRLKETPTFHMVKTLAAGSRKPCRVDLKAFELLKLCNSQQLDLALKSQSLRLLAGDRRLQEEGGMRPRLAAKSRQLLIKSRAPRLKSQATLIYERFFNKPNLNEIVNLSDLMKKRPQRLFVKT